MALNPSLRRTVLSLYLVQFASYATPLATLPWLTRVLGPTGYGRLSFCAAVTSYFILFADYGFNFSATREIAQLRDDPAGRSAVFWNTLAIKAVLAAIGLPIMLGLTFVLHRLAADRSLLLVTYLSVVGTVLTPTWYFQGTERQPLFSAITVGVRVLSVPATIALVRSAGDITWAAAVSSSTPVVIGIICLWLLVSRGDVQYRPIRARELVETIKSGWHLFLSTASVSLYGATNTVVLGMVAGSAAVGHYSAAEKVVQAAQGMLAPINQSVYPRVSRLMKESREDAYALIRRVLRVQGGISLALSAFLFIVAPILIRIVYGAQYEPTIAVLRWLSFLPFLVGLSNVFGIHTMLALGMKRSVSRILLAAGAINLVMLWVLAGWFGAVGAAASVVVTELFVTVVMALTLIRLRVPIFRRVLTV